MSQGKEKSKQVEIIATAADDSASDLQRLAERLSAAGMRVTNVLDFIGQVSGFVDRKDEAKLRKISGVSSVEVSGEVTLPPSDEDLQ